MNLGVEKDLEEASSSILITSPNLLNQSMVVGGEGDFQQRGVQALAVSRRVISRDSL